MPGLTIANTGFIGNISKAFLSFVGSTTGITNSLVHPSEAAIGDLCIVFEHGYDDDSDFFEGTYATSWTGVDFGSLLSSAAIYTSFQISYRVLPNLSNVTLGAASAGLDVRNFVAFYFRSTNSITSVTRSATVGKELTNANPAAQTINISPINSNANYLVFAATSVLSNTSPTLSTNTPGFDGSVATTNANISSTNYYKIYNSTPVNHTVDVDDNGSGNTLVSFYLEVV